MYIYNNIHSFILPTLIESLVFNCIYLFFWLRPQQAEVPGPGSKPVP